MMKFSVLCHKSILQPLSKLVNADCRAFESYDERSIFSLISDCNVLVSWLATNRIIEAGKNLRFIQCWGIGVDEIDVQFASERGVTVANMAGYNSSATAEYCLGALLLLSRQLNVCNSFKPKSNSFLQSTTEFDVDSTYKAQYSRELAGKTLAIIGYGSIGRQIVVRAKAFGMNILAVRRSTLSIKDENVEFVGTLKDLHMVLQKADFVTINLPLTSETKGVFGQKAIESMKPTAYLVNSSRTGIVDDKALLLALKKRSIAGAMLDVYDQFLEKQLLKMDNVILTPHIAGWSEESTVRGIKIVAENINRLINGQPLLNVISPDRLY
jgi:D-3-phosphoglycerate dehydrogenase